MTTVQSETRWWHVYGGEVLFNAHDHPNWCMEVYGDSGVKPDDVPRAIAANATVLNNGTIEATQLAYLGSFDSEPTEKEKEALTPDIYRS